MAELQEHCWGDGMMKGEGTRRQTDAQGEDSHEVLKVEIGVMRV